MQCCAHVYCSALSCIPDIRSSNWDPGNASASSCWDPGVASANLGVTHVQRLHWDTSDGHLHLKHSAAFPRPRSIYDAGQLTQQIAADVAAADHGESFQSAHTQQLYFVPQANVLSGANGAPMTGAEKKAALDKKKRSAKAQQLSAEQYMGAALHPAPLHTGHPQPFGGEARPYLRPMPRPFGKEVRPIGA